MEKQKCKKATTRTGNPNNVRCDICYKIFYDKGQKLKPKYALTHHQKTCREITPKKFKNLIKQYLVDINDFEFIKKMELEFREQAGMEWIEENYLSQKL